MTNVSGSGFLVSGTRKKRLVNSGHSQWKTNVFHKIKWWYRHRFEPKGPPPYNSWTVFFVRPPKMLFTFVHVSSSALFSKQTEIIAHVLSSFRNKKIWPFGGGGTYVQNTILYILAIICNFIYYSQLKLLFRNTLLRYTLNRTKSVNLS